MIRCLREDDPSAIVMTCQDPGSPSSHASQSAVDPPPPRSPHSLCGTACHVSDVALVTRDDPHGCDFLLGVVDDRPTDGSVVPLRVD